MALLEKGPTRDFSMGDVVVDTITGYTGMVTGKADFITGCTQYLVQPRVEKPDTKPVPEWLDEDRLQRVKETETAFVVTKAGPDRLPDREGR